MIARIGAERAARVRKLQTITQAEYNYLLAIVKVIVPRNFASRATPSARAC